MGGTPVCLYLVIYFLSPPEDMLFDFRGREGEKHRQLPLIHTPAGDQTRNLGICLTRNQTRNFSVCRTPPNPPSPTGQGKEHPSLQGPLALRAAMRPSASLTPPTQSASIWVGCA